VRSGGQPRAIASSRPVSAGECLLVVSVPLIELRGACSVGVAFAVGGLAGSDLGKRPASMADGVGGLGCAGHAHLVLRATLRFTRCRLANVIDVGLGGVGMRAGLNDVLVGGAAATDVVEVVLVADLTIRVFCGFRTAVDVVPTRLVSRRRRHCNAVGLVAVVAHGTLAPCLLARLQHDVLSVANRVLGGRGRARLGFVARGRAVTVDQGGHVLMRLHASEGGGVVRGGCGAGLGEDFVCGDLRVGASVGGAADLELGGGAVSCCAGAGGVGPPQGTCFVDRFQVGDAMAEQVDKGLLRRLLPAPTGPCVRHRSCRRLRRRG
jgi:hypothetical protein